MLIAPRLDPVVQFSIEIRQAASPCADSKTEGQENASFLSP
jgi:hypothetical protein